MDKIKASTLADLAYYSRFKPPSRLITFAAPASTLTNFPALVKSNSTFHIGTSTGYDVHFQDLSGNELYYDLDYYDPVTGNGAWWVLIPSLPSSGPTSIKMLYGDSSVTTNGSTPATVWSGYLAVYHFNSTDTSQQFNSAQGGYDVWSEQPNYNKTASFTSGGVTGRMLSVYQWFSWNGTSALTTTIQSVAEDIYNAVSIMEANPFFGAIGSSDTGARIARLGRTSSSINLINTYSNQFYYRQKEYTSGDLEYLNASWRSSDSTVSWQINDTLETGTLATSWTPGTTSVVSLSCYRESGAFTTYKIDELRLRRDFASPDYASYEYNQLMNHSTYTTYGPEA